MATTTNYGWTTPNDTDLVKDGASAIRTLGTAIDTTTKNLNPSTTLGDIEYRSSTANTNTRLGIGSSGQVLTVSGGVPTWSAVNAGGMTEIASGTLSGASVTVNSISSSYKDLVIYLAGVKQSTTTTSYIKLNNAANVGSANIYSTSLGYGTTGSYIWISSSDTGLCMESSLGENSFAYTINNYAATTRKAIFGTGGYRYPSNADIRGFLTYGDCSDTTAISRVDFVTSSGKFSGGTYAIYGVK